MDSARFSDIHDIVRTIPLGRVTTYGVVARRVGRCTPRMVGWALAGVPSASGIPWHRVINARGTISLTGEPAERQRALLEAEGIEFEGGRIDLERFGWSAEGR